VLFSFVFGLGLLRNGDARAAGTPCVPALFTCFYLEEGGNKRQPRHKHIGTHISFPSAPVGWTRRHIHTDVPVRMCQMGGRNAVTWQVWGEAQATAEQNRELCSVCMPLDLISPTCPCHSDSQPR